MDFPEILTMVVAFIVLFLFALQKFSRHIQDIAGEHFRTILNNWTKTPLRGFFAGTIVTAIIQSSTATSIILVSLVNAGIMTFEQSLGAIIGSNIGTTLTVQLIALRMTYVAPLVLIAGFVISRTHSRFWKHGKTMFYFGMMFISMLAISYFLEPLKDSEIIRNILGESTGLFSAIIIGMVITAILQSSGVFTGLVILFGAGGLIGLYQAIALILGANIGTTATALIASLNANKEAKKVAVANALFNIVGVLLILPFLNPFANLIEHIAEDITQQIVNAHFLFNMISAVIGLILIKPFSKIVSWITKNKS